MEKYRFRCLQCISCNDHPTAPNQGCIRINPYLVGIRHKRHRTTYLATCNQLLHFPKRIFASIRPEPTFAVKQSVQRRRKFLRCGNVAGEPGEGAEGATEFLK